MSEDKKITKCIEFFEESLLLRDKYKLHKGLTGNEDVFILMEIMLKEYKNEHNRSGKSYT